jgi:hypothetical protein
MDDYPYSPSEVEADPSGRHRVSVAHLVMGVAFLGLATIWLMIETKVVLTDDLRWFLPLPWLAAGLAGLLAVALTGRRTKPENAAAPVHAESARWRAEPDVAGAEDDL